MKNRIRACGLMCTGGCGGKNPLCFFVFCGLFMMSTALANNNCSCEVLPIAKAGNLEVCGQDGLPYASACLSLCQGVAVADSISSCRDLSLELTQRGPHGPVYKRDLKRFEEGGYRYLGMVSSSLNISVVASEKMTVLDNSIDILFTADGGVYSRLPERKQSPEGLNQSRRATPNNPGIHMSNEAHARPLGVAYLQIYGDNGLDDRLRVMDTTYEPWRRLGFVEPSGCTGAMIGPRHVLTSAHCVYDRQKNQFDLGIRFIPALMGEQRPFGWTSASHVLVKSCFLASGLRECDFAVIVLKENVGINTGWFGFGLDCTSKSVDLETAGYPADKPKGTMWRETCGISEVACDDDPGLMQHNCDMTDGMSGAPLWDAAQNIRAIHRGYIFGRNIAVYITPFVFDNLLSWTSYSYAAKEGTNSRG